nr:hypothetical protein CFP56_43878 [Quercus suber]
MSRCGLVGEGRARCGRCHGWKQMRGEGRQAACSNFSNRAHTWCAGTNGSLLSGGGRKQLIIGDPGKAHTSPAVTLSSCARKDLKSKEMLEASATCHLLDHPSLPLGQGWTEGSTYDSQKSATRTTSLSVRGKTTFERSRQLNGRHLQILAEFAWSTSVTEMTEHRGSRRGTVYRQLVWLWAMALRFDFCCPDEPMTRQVTSRMWSYVDYTLFGGSR